jgi:hypothetical protein
VHPEILVNESTASDYEVMLNMPSNIAGNPSVHLQFIYDGTILYGSYYGYYFWMIDDIRLIETPDHLLVRQDETFGGWWLGYQITGDIGVDYTFNPMSQAIASPYRFESVVKNNGATTQTNTKLNILVEDISSNVIFSGTSDSVSINSGSNDTLAISPNFTPSNMGEYNFSFWASSDSFPTTDTTVMSSIVTDTVYGVDRDWNSDGANAGSGFFLGRSCGGQVLANAFDIYANTTLTSISFHVNDQSVAGAKLSVELYETNGQIYLEESDEYTITASDIGSWVTLPLLTPYPLFAGTSYMAAVRGQQHPTDTSLISSTGNKNTSRWLQDNGCDAGGTASVAGTWYTISKALLIRMNFGDLVSPSWDCDESTGGCFDPGTGQGQYSSLVSCQNTCIISSVENIELKSNVNIYPNPTKGVFNISLMKNKDCVISIDNVLGQTVYKKIHNNLNFTTIDLSSLEKGVYMVNIQFDNSSSLTKVVVE